jgi:glycosyltransferase involved in cell wall biosynthesis
MQPPRLPRPRSLQPKELPAGADQSAPAPKRLSLSVVIPTLNDADRLAGCLEPLASAARRGIDLEVLVVDGGSTDGTVEIAERIEGLTLRVIVDEAASRGARMQMGARAATAEWVLFLRPESWLDRGWDATIVVFASEERNRDRAAVFDLAPLGRTEDAVRGRRFIRWRNRWLGLPDGRQGFLIRRRHLSHLGGVPDLRNGESLVMARRMGARRIALFDVAVRVNTDAKRSVWGNGLKLALFSLRIPARWLQGIGD